MIVAGIICPHGFRRIQLGLIGPRVLAQTNAGVTGNRQQASIALDNYVTIVETHR